MADPMLTAEPPPPQQLPSSDLGFDDFSAEFDNLPIPSMESLFDNDALPSEAFASDLDFAMDFGDNGEFEITFDDIDSFHTPSDAEDFLLPDACNPNGASISPINDVRVDSAVRNSQYDVVNSDSPEFGDSAVSGDRSSGVSRFFNSQASDSVSCKQELTPVDNSGNSVGVKASSFHCSESEEESSNGPVSSQGSGNGGSGVYEVMNSPSPDSGRYERDISSFHALAAADNDIKLEEIGKGCDLKRKKEQNEGSAETRTNKYRRSSVNVENKTQQSQSDVNAVDDDEEKRKARLMRNRESAQLSRQRKKHYVEELEEKVKSMHSTIADLSSKISFVMAENATLRQQLGAGGMCPPPAPGMYPHPPMAPMPYPWMPCAPYVVKPQGSQVPLVPIPRLKPQQPAPPSKAKKSESKKSEVKTKKVASISLLGFFFFIMLFGGLVPLVNVKFGGLVENVTGRPSYVSDRFYGYGQGGGKVWPVNGHRNGSGRDGDVGFSNGRFSISDGRNYERGRKLEETHERQDPHSHEFVRRGNESEPLLASLYVPRNDKLVKIDGNLIIHSILASEKAMASQTAQTKKEKRETGLAIPKEWDSALAIPEVGRNRGQHPHVYRVPPEQRKALGSGSAQTLKDHMKSTAHDGKMQQWFREGLAGPMLSSGMCTEVFQFDVSPTPGAIVPASSIANISAANRQNATTLNKSRNRRILHRLPDALTGSSLNITEDHVRKSQNDHLHGNKSSMVVSVLVDPKEAADGDVDGMMTPKSLSRIFVVVLMDSVKYVTYSCGLPRASPHLVTA